MIERLLAADAALDRGELDAAERLYRQVADADARNAIALVGLARVADARGDADGARGLAERALSIDAQEAAARRMLEALTTPATAALPTTVAPAPRGGLRGLLRRLFGGR
jgi:tetratricopeptide (TPR) repeat protein